MNGMVQQTVTTTVVSRAYTYATRPLAIQKDGTWYTYGWDLTKNICEVYGQHGFCWQHFSKHIYVTKQREGNKDYILTTYHVYNTASKQSYYLRQPDFITDFIFNSNLKDWEQNYFWREKYDCIDMFIDCIDPCMYMHMAPGNPFAPLM